VVQEVAELAGALGNHSEHSRLSAMAQRLLRGYNQAFWHGANRSYDLGLQTDHSLAIQMLGGFPSSVAAPYLPSPRHEYPDRTPDLTEISLRF
jgi:hypothetical protein